MDEKTVYLLEFRSDTSVLAQTTRALSDVERKFSLLEDSLKKGYTQMSSANERFVQKTVNGSEVFQRVTKTYIDSVGKISSVMATFNAQGQLTSFDTSGLSKFDSVSTSVIRQAQVMNAEFGKYIPVSESVVHQAQAMNDQFNKGALSLKEVQGQTKGTVISLGNYWDAMKRVAIVVPVWATTRLVMQSFTNTLRDGVKFLIDWETKMAEIRIVGKGTADEYANLSRNMLRTASTIGVASSQVAEGAKLLAQAGFEISAISPVLETVTKLSVLTGRSVSDAVEDVISLMKNYKIEAQDTSVIIDKLVATELNHAVTTKDLVEALRLVAPVATQANISLEKMLGIITASVVATRRSGSEVARSWNFILTRMATVAQDAIQSIAKIPIYVDATGKAVTNNTGSLRSMGDVLDELAISWSTLDTVQKDTLAKQIAGTRQIAVFKSAMQQWREGIDATIESMDSFGKGQKALAILLETTKSKTEQLKGTWQGLIQDTIDTGLIKDGIGLLKDFANTLSIINSLRAGTVDSVGAQKALTESFKEQNNIMVQRKELLMSAQQLSASLISLEQFRNRLVGEGVGLEDKRVKSIDAIANQIAGTLASKGVAGFGDLLKTPVEEWVTFLKSKEPEIQEALLSQNAVTNVTRRLQVIKSAQADLVTSIKSTGSQAIPIFGTPVGIDTTIEQLQKLRDNYSRLSEQGKKADIFGNKNTSDKQLKDLERLIGLIDVLITKKQEDAKFNIDVEVSKEKENIKLQQEKIDLQVQQKEVTQETLAGIEALAKKGFTQLEIEKQKLDYYLKQKNTLADAEEDEVKKLKNSISKLQKEKEYSDLLVKEQDLEKDMERSGQSQLQIAIQHLAYLKQINSGKQVQQDQERKIFNLQKDYISSLKTDYLGFLIDADRIRGVNTITSLENQIRLEKDATKQLQLQLELKKEQLKASQGQAEFTDREIKLYEIAQKNGIKTAQTIADLFKDGISLDEISGLSKKEQAVFGTNFADVQKNLQLQQFFKENTGLQAPTSRETSAAITQANFGVKVGDINVKVDVNSAELKQKMLDELGRALDKPSSDIVSKIKRIVLNT